MKQVLKRFFYVVIGLFVIGYLVGNNEDGSKPSSSEQASQSDSVQTRQSTSVAEAAPVKSNPPPKPVYQTTARKLFNDYDENEVAVDEQLKGKIVAVSGIVQSIDKDFTDSIIISLKTDNEFMPARLDMKDSQKATAISLKKGMKVVIVCERMSRIIGAPSGRNCTFK
ncbi:OB-fold protein [Pantoea sp. C2G6]|uniref:OB-fold protein n=1 Tax=Pantoea sp. C2G6 TaxID=3243084 RepID=UPI003ED86652